jgi:uncharacterized protein
MAVQPQGTPGDGPQLITLGTITKIADRDGVQAHVVERDYVLTHIVDALARTNPLPGLIFKGGTALRLCFYDDFRYSADLDFSLREATPDEAQQAIEQALNQCKSDIALPHLELDPTNDERIDYEGPLGARRHLKLNVADDELVIEVCSRPVIRRYDDQTDPPPDVVVYTIQEITAEKLRCIIQRLQCRDVTDLHRALAQEGVDVEAAWVLFEEKARHKGLDPEQFSERLASRSDGYRDRWERELGTHFGPTFPDFERVMRELRRALRGKL